MYIKWRFYFEQNKRKSNNKSALAIRSVLILDLVKQANSSKRCKCSITGKLCQILFLKPCPTPQKTIIPVLPLPRYKHNS